jgi:hypothetical protein
MHFLDAKFRCLAYISHDVFGQKLVATLTPEEKESAAQGSFAYWLASISNAKPTEAERLRMATREARRFLGNPYDVAELGLKQACQFRKVKALV